MTRHRMIGSGHWDGRIGLCSRLRSERMEVLWELLEVGEREVFTYRVGEYDHDKKDRCEEKRRYLVHVNLEPALDMCVGALMFSR